MAYLLYCVLIDSSKFKEFADDNLRFDENSRKLSKQVENTEGRGEIARYEQFLLFPQCFQRTSAADTQKPGLVWEKVKANYSGCRPCGKWMATINNNTI